MGQRWGASVLAGESHPSPLPRRAERPPTGLALTGVLRAHPALCWVTKAPALRGESRGPTAYCFLSHSPPNPAIFSGV